MHNYRVLVFVSCLLLPAVDQASGQDLTLHGYVRDELTFDAVNSAEVQIKNSDGRRTWKVTTTATGEFRLAVPAGQYAMTVKAPGFDTVSRSISIAGAAVTAREDVLLPRQFLIRFGARSGLDLTLIQPGSFVYFDRGVDDEGEVDFFKNGKMSLSIQLLGLDLVAWTERGHGTRVGSNIGLGIATAQPENNTSSGAPEASSGSAVMFSWSAFLDLRRFARIEVGYIKGYSAAEGLDGSQRTDGAAFVGISLKTTLGNELVRILR